MDEYKMVDIKDIRSFMSDFLSFLGKAVRYVFVSIKIYWRSFALIFLLVTATGWYRWYQQPAYYEADMVCSYNNLHQKVYGEMMHHLDILARSHSWKQLSQTLHITPKEASAIISIDAKNISGSPLYEDVSGDRLPMYFTIRTDNRNIYPVLERAILSYLNSTPIQQQKDRAEQEKIRAKTAYLDHAIAKTDSVIDAYTHFLMHATTVPDSSAGYPAITALFTYQERLVDEKLGQIQHAQLLKSVDLVYGFQPSDNPVIPSKKGLLKWGAAALLLAAAVSTCRNLWTNG